MQAGSLSHTHQVTHQVRPHLLFRDFRADEARGPGGQLVHEKAYPILP